MFLVMALLAACGNAEAGSKASKTHLSEVVIEKPLITVAQVRQKGFVYLGAPIDGMTAPSNVGGAIAEGSPTASTVFFGVKNTPGTEADRRYACAVPQQFVQAQARDFSKVEINNWKCVKIGA